MSDEQTRTPLEAIEAMESGAFRLGHVVRRLLAEHPDLPVRRIHQYVSGSAFLDEAPAVTAQVEISVRGIDSVRACAEALGGEVKVTVMGAAAPFEHAELPIVIDGVELRFVSTRRLSEDEAAAWRAEQGQAAAEPMPGGGR